MNNNFINNKEFKNITINSYIGFIIIGFWAIILISVIIHKIKLFEYDTINCIKYNEYNQCIEYK